MIILDATEARSNTKMPDTVIQSSYTVNGLEALTGADFVISPLSEPILPDKLKDTVPHRRLLLKHTRAGMLVQRKHGLDLLSSIPDLCNIEKRMMDWCGKIGPWLLTVGRFEQRTNGRFIVNSQEALTNYNMKSVKAALDFWQLRGGGVTELHSDYLIAAWVNHWHESVLHKLDAEPERLVIDLPPAQAMKGPEDDWWVPLAVIPTIGPKKARVLAEWLPKDKRTLADAVVYLCDSRNEGFDRPPGFGPKTFQATRQLFGLTDDDTLCIISSSQGESKYPIIITWPVGANAATIDGQWWRRDDGRIEAAYNSSDELRICMRAVGVIE